MKEIISFADFEKIDLRTGIVRECVQKEGSDKLLKLAVDFGEYGQRTIFTGLAKWYKPEYFIGNTYVFICNLAPRKMMDEYSEGMLLAADGEIPIPLVPQEKVPAGTSIR